MKTKEPKVAEHVSVELVTIIPEYQRQVKQWHVDELAEYMRSGQFNPNESITVNLTPTGEVLIDGQHRLLAIIACRLSFVMPLVTVTVESDEQARENCLRTDIGLGRTKVDAIHSMGLAATYNTPESAITSILAAAKLIENRFFAPRQLTSKERSRDEMIKRVQTWIIPGTQYLEAVSGRRFLKKRLKSSPVMAVGMVTMADQKFKALPEYKNAVLSLLRGRDDATTPEMGWPWPWLDSNTTDYAYAFENGVVYCSRFGRPWFIAKEAPPEDYADTETNQIEFPNMEARQKVAWDRRSGLTILGVPTRPT